MAVQAPQAPSQRLSYQTPSGYDVKHDSPASNAAATPLPQGWLEMQDPSGSGRTLYCNPSTGQTSWERPGVRTLPPGWIKATTPEGNDIFIHPETQRCTFQWPEQEAALPSQSAGGAAPAIARTITAPSSTSVQPKPRIVRSQTVPVQPPQATQTITARKPVPVLDPSSTIELLSDRNNTRVLSHKFASDLAQTTTAMKEVTISGASLATRQVKVVGQTLVSRKKLGKASKKLVVHTGALTVKTGRAFKGLVNEMVDAADKKGKYEPKHQRSVRPNVKAASQSPHQNTPVHGHQPRHPMTKNENPPNYSPATVTLSEKQPAPAPAPAPAIISRKMTARKPVGSQSVAVVNSDAPHIANGSNQSNPQDASSFNNNGGTFTGITERNSENEGTRALPVSVEANVNPRVASARPHAPQRVRGAASQASSPAPLQRRPPQQAVSQISSNAPTPVAAAPWVANAHQMQVQRLPKPTSRPSSLKTASTNPVPQQGIMPPGSIPRPPSYTQATSEPLARPAPRPSSRLVVQPHLGPAARPPARPAANRPQQGKLPNHQMRPRPQHPGVTQNGVADTINSVTKLVHQFASAVPTGHGMDTSGANGASTSLPQYAASSLGSPDDQNQTFLTTDGGQGQGSANPVLAGLGSGSGQRASTQNMAVQRPVASSDQSPTALADDTDQDQFADEGYGIDQDHDADDADDGQQVDDTLDADQSLDVDDAGEVDQSQDLDPTGDVDQSQYLDQTDGVDDVPYGDETLDVDQDQYVDETYDADQVEFNEETFEVDQTQYDEEVPYVDETVDFDEAGEMDQNQDVDIDVSYVEDDTAALSTYDDAVEDDVVEDTVDEEVVYEEEDTVSVDAYEVDCEVDVEVDATEEDGDEDVDVDVEQDDSEVCW